MMDINLVRVLAIVAVIALVGLAGFLAGNDLAGWGWFLFVAVLITGAIFR